MDLFPLRYKTIKDNNKLSGRGAVKQWQYFTAMDDLMAGDPSVYPRSIETTSTVVGTLLLIQVFPCCVCVFSFCISVNEIALSSCMCDSEHA